MNKIQENENIDKKFHLDEEDLLLFSFEFHSMLEPIFESSISEKAGISDRFS